MLSNIDKSINDLNLGSDAPVLDYIFKGFFDLCEFNRCNWCTNQLRPAPGDTAQAYFFNFDHVRNLRRDPYLSGGVRDGAPGRSEPLVRKLICLAGVLFLIWFGLRALLRAVQGTSTLGVEEGASGTARGTIVDGVGFSLLNPHAYLDAMVLLGGMATRFDGNERASFAGGAVMVSTCWFFLVAYGAHALLQLFRGPKAWVAFDLGIAVVIWWLAFGLAGRLV